MRLESSVAIGRQRPVKHRQGSTRGCRCFVKGAAGAEVWKGMMSDAPKRYGARVRVRVKSIHVATGISLCEPCIYIYVFI